VSAAIGGDQLCNVLHDLVADNIQVTTPLAATATGIKRAKRPPNTDRDSRTAPAAQAGKHLSESIQPNRQQPGIGPGRQEGRTGPGRA
jgi:hypothetical protein